MKRLTVPALMALVITSCGAETNGEGLTSGEQRELDEAASRLDAAREEYEATVETAPPEGEDAAAE